MATFTMSRLLKASFLVLALADLCVSSPVRDSGLQKRQSQDLSFSLRGALPFNSNPISRSGWKVSCDSVQPGNECNLMIDGDNTTFWHTAYSFFGVPPPPHQVIVDMGSSQSVSGIGMTPRQDGNQNGWIGSHQLFLSQDNVTWTPQVAFGTWYADSSEKFTSIEPQSARYVKLVANSEANGGPWTSLAELNVYTPAQARNTNTGPGRWGATLDLPVVPVSAALEPTSGHVLLWSAWRDDQYDGGAGGWTLTATYDPSTGAISQRNVSETGHDMFCPGISMGMDGKVVVTGGANAEKTSIYDPIADSWVSAPNMVLTRGYQASAAMSDGRIFTIGGSWNGGNNFFKNGEAYSPSANAWTSLPGALAQPMMTNDRQGQFRSDNHAWLFGWKNGTVFQAGPSLAMNWYSTTSTGGTAPAGNRTGDADAMCGTATMFDAVAGKILAVGGSPNYQDDSSTTNAHIITINNPNTTASVIQASNGLWFNRIFHSSVVLPDGTVFINGGQQVGSPFHDTTPQLTPELYDPVSDHFIKLASNSIVRVYHSIALLLPDATVLVGGGGLCGPCNSNHLDAQIFSPPYLFDSQGNPVTNRPVIQSVSAKTFKVGDTVSLTTGGTVAKASLVRYSTITHTVNTDQRRIPVSLTSTGGNNFKFTIPNDPGVALPGYWLLFVLDSRGVPSNATTIQIKNM